MVEPSQSIQGPMGGGGDGQTGDKPRVAVDMGARGVGWFERFMLMTVLVTIGILVAVVVLPIMLVVMVGIVIYVAAALVAGLIRGRARIDPLEAERRNVRVRGKMEQ